MPCAGLDSSPSLDCWRRMSGTFLLARILRYVPRESLMFSGLRHPVLCSVWNTGVITTAWDRRLTVPILEGMWDAWDCNNYRGITLLMCSSKSALGSFWTWFNISSQSHQHPEQSGLTPKKSAVDHILVFRVLPEQMWDFNSWGQSVVLPILLYSNEAWTLSSPLRQRLESFMTTSLCCIFDYHWALAGPCVQRQGAWGGQCRRSVAWFLTVGCASSGIWRALRRTTCLPYSLSTGPGELGPAASMAS